MHHQEQDARSLALHTAAIELMRADESLIQRALDLLARWDTHVSVSSKHLRDEWVRILRERDWDLALSVSERGNQLRQASPVSCVLPNERRLEIIRATATHRDQLHLLSSENCPGQVFSHRPIGCLIADFCSKALGGKLPSLECSRWLF